MAWDYHSGDAMSVKIVNGLDVRELAAGARHNFALSVARLADGSHLNVPVHVITGTGEGSCLAVVAGVHGDEPEGISAVFELSRELDPRSFQGRLILVPIANPPAFAANQRRSPIDSIDLNRVFPGRADGTPSERLAHQLFELVKNNADFLFTLHSWYATGDSLPHVEVAAEDTPISAAGYEAAFASGFEYVRAASWNAGLFPSAVNRAGIPAMEAEIGGMGRSRPNYRRQYKEHVLKLMLHLGMREGPSRSPAIPAKRTIHVSQHVVAGTGGVLLSDVPLGTLVNEGEPLGIITDPHGTQLETLRSPFAGVLLARRHFLSVAPGDLAFTVFRPAP
jgi:predicted deacylase